MVRKRLKTIKVKDTVKINGKPVVVDAKTKKAYLEYRRRFYKEKREGFTYKGARLFKLKDFTEVFQTSGGLSVTKILNVQIVNKKQWRKAYEQYNKLIKEHKITRGKNVEYLNTFFGDNMSDDNGQAFKNISYHRTLKGFMNDKYAKHFMFTQQYDDKKAELMNKGMSEEEAKKKAREAVEHDYGYDSGN